MAVAINVYAVPYAFENMEDVMLRALYGVGWPTVTLSRDTGEIVGHDREQVVAIPKANGRLVDVAALINGSVPHVSAVVGSRCNVVNTFLRHSATTSSVTRAQSRRRGGRRARSSSAPSGSSSPRIRTEVGVSGCTAIEMRQRPTLAMRGGPTADQARRPGAFELAVSPRALRRQPSACGRLSGNNNELIHEPLDRT